MNSLLEWHLASLGCAVAAVVSVLADVQPVHLPAPAQPPDTSLGCSWHALPSGGSEVQIQNLGRLVLPANQPLAWSSLGSPAPVGEGLRLPQPLGPGETLSLPSRWRVAGSGCQAVLHHG